MKSPRRAFRGATLALGGGHMDSARSCDRRGHFITELGLLGPRAAQEHLATLYNCSGCQGASQVTLSHTRGPQAGKAWPHPPLAIPRTGALAHAVKHRPLVVRE